MGATGLNSTSGNITSEHLVLKAFNLQPTQPVIYFSQSFLCYWVVISHEDRFRMQL